MLLAAGPGVRGSAAGQRMRCTATPPKPARLQLTEVAPGTFMARGAAGEVNEHNLGRIGNAGFIVGDRGVIAVDTGTSYRHGKALLEAIGCVTSKPVRLALITHARQEFLFGAAAYREQGIPLHMHREASAMMTARCEDCLRTLRRTLGEDAMRGTVMFKPDRVFDGSHRLAQIGRPVEVLHYGHSSGPGDIVVLDAQTGTLFAGGMLDNERIPDVYDSDLAGWRRALRALHALPLELVVPGHGPAASPALVDTMERYLLALEARLRALLDAGVPLSEVPDRAGLPDFQQWDRYDTIHRRNASVVFVRMEREQFSR